MPDDQFRLALGQFEIRVLRDRDLAANARFLFSNVDASTCDNHLRDEGYDPAALDGSFNCAAVYTNDDWVLIDAGSGHLMEQPGNLAKLLDDDDIRPEHIIITHGHSDHFGGLVDENGHEQFPNVPIYMCQDEWAVCTSKDYAEQDARSAQAVKQVLSPLRGQVERVECYGDILPGFSILRLPGHTAHHIGVVVESRGERLLIAADAAIHPMHLMQLDWHFTIDHDHKRARESRVKLAEYAIEHDAWVLFYHFPFPGIGKISREHDGYRWHPVDG